MKKFDYEEFIRENTHQIAEEAKLFRIDLLPMDESNKWYERSTLIKLFAPNNVVGDFNPNKILNMREFTLEQYRLIAKLHLINKCVRFR